MFGPFSRGGPRLAPTDAAPPRPDPPSSRGLEEFSPKALADKWEAVLRQADTSGDPLEGVWINGYVAVGTAEEVAAQIQEGNDKLLEAYQRELQSDNYFDRLEAAHVFLFLGLQQDAARDILKQLCRDEHLDCRIIAAFALVMCFTDGDSRAAALPVLRECCAYKSMRLSYHAAFECVAIDRDGPVGREAAALLLELIDKIDDPGVRVRLAFMVALAWKSEAVSVLPMLVSAVDECTKETQQGKNGTFDSVACGAVMGLRLIGETAKEAVPSLVALMRTMKHAPPDKYYVSIANDAKAALNEIIVGSNGSLDDSFLYALLTAPLGPPGWVWRLLEHEWCQAFIRNDLFRLVAAVRQSKHLSISPSSLLEEVKPEIALILQEDETLGGIAPSDYMLMLSRFKSRSRGRVEYYLQQIYRPGIHRRRRRATDKVPPWSGPPTKKIPVYERPSILIMDAMVHRKDEGADGLVLQEAQAAVLDLIGRQFTGLQQELLLHILLGAKSRRELADKLGLNYDQIVYAVDKLAREIPTSLRLPPASIAAFAEFLRGNFGICLTPGMELKEIRKVDSARMPATHQLEVTASLLWLLHRLQELRGRPPI